MMGLFRLRKRNQETAAPEGAPVYLIVGLGNPGREYRDTRHNAGFMVIDRLSEVLKIGITRAQERALVGSGVDDGRKVILAKPITYMNLSGTAVSALMRFYKVPLENLLLIHDDIDLPLGTLRIRGSGGSGGQKGLASTIERLGTENIARMRVGIGRPPGQKMAADYVLRPFDRDEQELVRLVLDRAADASLLFIRSGIDTAMNRYNGALPKD